LSSGIYRIVNLINGKCYVGQTADLKNRERQHFNDLKSKCHKNRHLQSAYNLYGLDNFKFEILELVEIPNSIVARSQRRDYLIQYEQKWIDHFNSFEGGYNLVPSAGSNLGMVVSEETRSKLRKARSSYKPTDETCERISKSLKGRRFTDEHRAKLSQTRKGMKFTDETKERLAQSHAKQRYLVTFPDGETVEITNLNGFCKKYNLNRTGMGRVCNGKLPIYKGY